VVWFRASCTVAPVGDDRVSVLQWHRNQPPSWGPDWWFSSVAREDFNALLQKPDFLICHYCVSSSPWFQLALGCTAKKGTSLSWHFVIAIALEMSYHWTIHITFCGSAVLISQSIVLHFPSLLLLSSFWQQDETVFLHYRQANVVVGVCCFHLSSFAFMCLECSRTGREFMQCPV